MAKDKERKVTFSDTKMQDKNRSKGADYDYEINAAQYARDNQRLDTDPKIEKEGFLGMDDLDRLRRRKIGKIF